MGLDTTHDAWHGSYRAFGRWRDKLAEVAGYEIVKVDHGDAAFPRWTDTVMIDWGHVQPENFDGEWDETPADPLLVLIAHSDCDGVIHPAQAGPLADRLAELLPLLPDEEVPGHIGHWRRKTQMFVDGLRDAVERGEDVEFH